MEFEIIEDLSALDAEALRKYEAEALAAAQALLADDDVTDEALDQAQQIIDSRTAALDALSTLEAADEARAQRLADLRGATAEVEEEAVEEEPTAEVEEEAVEEEREPVLASAAKPVRRQVSAASRAGARQAKPVIEQDRPRATITAAADVPGVAAASEFASIGDLAEPTAEVLRSLARARSGYQEKGIASFTAGRSDGLIQSEFANDQALLDAARDEKRLKTDKGQGSLVAAGGWCAPSETIYDLCAGETLDGLWDVPSIQVNRGGVNFTKGPQFSDFYAGAYISQTEAQAIAGTEKVCATISCPPFTDVRLDVIGVCISVPILTEAAYPELVQRYISGTLVAHEHRKSLAQINRALTIAGAAVTVANPWPTAAGSILTAIELVVQGERQRYRLGLNETLEAVFPFWVKTAIRADLAERTGVDLINVSDSDIEAYFALRGIRAQYVYGWQPLVGTSSGAGPVIDFPANLEILIYPAGTFVAGTKDVITLNGVYDSTGLSTNVYTALFTEEGISLMNMCYSPRRITLPLQVTGLTAAALINQDWGTVNTTPAAPNVVVGA